MAEQTISSRAGVACMTCDNPDPCIYKISVTFGQNTQVWPEKPAIKMSLIDHGKGQKGTIQIEGKCNNTVKHHAVLTGGQKEKTLEFNAPQEVTLFYKDQLKDAEIESDLDSVWFYLSNLANPTDMYSEPRYYKLITQGCLDSRQYATIAVYPSVSFMVSVGLSFDFSHGERSVKERRDEQKKARQAMENVKPKNGNKLRSGWTTHTDPFYLTRQTAINVEYALTVQDMDYSAKFAEVNQVRKTLPNLEAINRVEKLLGYTKEYLAPDPDSKGTRSYQLLELKVDPINIGLAYAYGRTTSMDDRTHFLGFSAAPFMGMTAKLDLIQMGAAYCKIKKVVAKFREALARRNSNDKNYLDLECCLILTCNLSFQLGAAYKQKQWTFDAGNKNDLKLSLEGKVNVAFKTHIMIMEVAMGAGVAVKTAAGFELDQHDKGIDLAGYHNGIVAEIQVAVDARRNSSRNSIIEVKKKWKWVIADPLKASESPLRINLIGEERPINRPEIVPGAETASWEMGYDPNFKPKMDNIPFITGLPGM